jgi:hypothetical protein
LIAAGLLLSVALALGIAAVGDAAARRARVDAVADLTALAAVTGGDQGAALVASGNDAELRSLRRVDDLAVVTVAAGGAIGVAAARPAAG